MKRIYTIIIFLAFAAVAFGQNKITVTGTVTDAKGEPVIGAGVVVTGTSAGTITDYDGKYELKGIPSNAKIEFSAIGFKSQSLDISGRGVIDVVLKDEFEELSEVIVVAYGTKRSHTPARLRS